MLETVETEGLWAVQRLANSIRQAVHSLVNSARQAIVAPIESLERQVSIRKIEIGYHIRTESALC